MKMSFMKHLITPQVPGRLFRKTLPVINNMTSSKHTLAKRFAGTEENVWSEFNALAVKYNACNLGQGFPNFCAPLFIRQALADSALSDNPRMHQYTRVEGNANLVKNLAQLYSKEFNHSIDPMTDIVVANGAYATLFYSFQSFLNAGDEVIMIEPFFDTYKPMALSAGAKPVFVPLRPPVYGSDNVERSSADWKIDPEELAAAFTPRTKFLIINSPNNPLGKCYTREELEMIANLCIKNDVLCVSDEVYEWLAIPPNKHHRIANIPGMWDRTITIGSAGKTFSITGWKMGWAIGPKHLISSLQVAHFNVVNSCSTPQQEALAAGFEMQIAKLGQPDCYFTSLAAEIKPKRDMMADILRNSGFTPVVPEGGYFMLADISKHANKVPETEKNDARDFRFVRWMVKNFRLATIPVSCFYSDEHRHIGENYIRFCYFKKEETLLEAKAILQTIAKQP